MGAQELAVITARSRYMHRTAAGRILFYGTVIGLIIAGIALRKASKTVMRIVRIAAVVLILLSFAADLIFADK